MSYRLKSKSQSEESLEKFIEKFIFNSTHIIFLIAEFPESPPRLWTDHDRYEPGDALKANCSSPPSRPRAELTLTLNNIVVSSNYFLFIWFIYKTFIYPSSVSRHSLKFHTLLAINMVHWDLYRSTCYIVDKIQTTNFAQRIVTKINFFILIFYVAQFSSLNINLKKMLPYYIPYTISKSTC